MEHIFDTLATVFSFQDDCLASRRALGVIISFETPFTKKTLEG